VKIKFRDQIAHLLGVSLEQRQYLRDQPLIMIPYPRPVNLDGPQAQCKTPLLAVTVAIAGLFQSVTLALAFLPSQPLGYFLLQQILQMLAYLYPRELLQLVVQNSL
jgi:hypothetical protein